MLMGKNYGTTVGEYESHDDDYVQCMESTKGVKVMGIARDSVGKSGGLALLWKKDIRSLPHPNEDLANDSMVLRHENRTLQSRMEFGNVKKQVEKVSNQLEGILTRGIDSSNEMLYRDLEAQLEEILEKEDTMWKQRSKAHWNNQISEGKGKERARISFMALQLLMNFKEANKTYPSNKDMEGRSGKNKKGKFIAGLAERIQGVANSEFAEKIAAIRALEFSTELQLFGFNVEGDTKTIITAIFTGNGDFSVLGPLADDTRWCGRGIMDKNGRKQTC
ncbi:hypothetical protein ACH5RR_013495 [Cinchona calisaya]|uniref:RNase H type-1 domain-containing protein n=1 Tax=Cinchona calisaya TaxID=153742 RepID=A0ABD3A5Y4_9GENT